MNFAEFFKTATKHDPFRKFPKGIAPLLGFFRHTKPNRLVSAYPTCDFVPCRTTVPAPQTSERRDSRSPLRFRRRNSCSEYCRQSLSTSKRGRAHVSAELASLHDQQGRTKPLLQRGREHSDAEWALSRFGKTGHDYCQDRRSGLRRLPARTVHFTIEPFFIARRKIGASAFGIVSLQQSVVNSKSPGFIRFFLFTLTT